MTLARPLLLAALVAAAPAAVYEVGTGQAYASLGALPALAAGDEVRVHAGTYHEVHRFTQAGTAGARIWIHGVDAQRPVFDGTGFAVDGVLPNPRAVLQVEASYVTLEHLELRNAANGHNGSAIRITTFGAQTVGTIVRDCRLTACEMGLMSDSCDQTLIDRCEIDHNGVDDHSHNVYLGGQTTTMLGCWIHHSNTGINLKSRAHDSEIIACRIEASADGEVDLVDAAETATADSNALLLGCVIASVPRGPSNNHTRFIHWGQDSGGTHTGTLYACFNTMQAANGNIAFFMSSSVGDIVASGNVFVGSQTLQVVLAGPGAIGGADNWVPSGTAMPAGFTGTSAGADPIIAASGDPRPQSGSPLIDAGPTSATYVDGAGTAHSAIPTQEYTAPLIVAARASDGHPDIGAYEATIGGTTTGGTSTGGTTTAGTTTGTTTGGTTTAGTTTGTTTAGTTTGGTTTGGSGSGSSTGSVARGGPHGSHGCGHGAALVAAAIAVGLVRRRGA